MTFDEAIELLEITKIDLVDESSLPKIVRKAKRRWHPDRVSHENNQDLIDEYTKNFQSIEKASTLILQYLTGSYNAGSAFKGDRPEEKEPEEVVRENAQELQKDLDTFYKKAKEHNFKHSVEEVELSDGFVLADLIQSDYDDGVASKSFVSMSFGFLIFVPLAFIFALISDDLIVIPFFLLVLHLIACFIAMLPLSRFWLNDSVVEVVLIFVNFGLGVEERLHNWAQFKSGWVQLPLILMSLTGVLIKYLVALPLTIIAKIAVGDKIVGVVKENVNYYAGAADWYIEKLIKTNPTNLDKDQLFDLSYLHGQLKEVKSL